MLKDSVVLQMDEAGQEVVVEAVKTAIERKGNLLL